MCSPEPFPLGDLFPDTLGFPEASRGPPSHKPGPLSQQCAGSSGGRGLGGWCVCVSQKGEATSVYTYACLLEVVLGENCGRFGGQCLMLPVGGSLVVVGGSLSNQPQDTGPWAGHKSISTLSLSTCYSGDQVSRQALGAATWAMHIVSCVPPCRCVCFSSLAPSVLRVSHPAPCPCAVPESPEGPQPLRAG